MDESLRDPFAGYFVYAHNKGFTDDVCGIRFVDGTARIDPITRTDDNARRLQVRTPDGDMVDGDYADLDVQERYEALTYFLNCHKVEVPIRSWDEERNIMTVTGHKLEPAYVVQRQSSEQSAAQPKTRKQLAAEMAAAAGE